MIIFHWFVLLSRFIGSTKNTWRFELDNYRAIRRAYKEKAEFIRLARELKNRKAPTSVPKLKVVRTWKEWDFRSTFFHHLEWPC